MKTVLTALALTVTVVACGKKAQETPLDPTTTPVVAEPAKVETAPVVAVPVETTPVAPAATTEVK